MRNAIVKSSLFLAVATIATSAFAGVPCEELKTKIDDGLKAKNVQNYSLKVIGTADTADGKVVGTCDGGTKKIVYSKDGAAAAAKPAADQPADKKPAAAK